MSIEQTNDFHMVRRIVKTIDPEYRLLSSNRVPSGSCILDMVHKTIEVGESDDIIEAVEVLLFQVGHLRLSKCPTYSLFCGERIRGWEKSPEELVEKLSRVGVRADIEAARWASFALELYWPTLPDMYDDLVSRYAWDRAAWRKYFSEP